METLDLQIIKDSFCSKNRKARNGKQIVIGNGYRRFYKDGYQKKISKSWTDEMEIILNKYIDRQSEITFYEDVNRLHRAMNNAFPDGFERGFNYIDALRSLSAALKYRWCNDKEFKEFPEPPLCPISKPHLVEYFPNERFSKIPLSQIKEKEAKEIFKHFKARAKDKSNPMQMSVAVWELITFDKID